VRPAILFLTLSLAAPALKDPPKDQGIVGEWVMEKGITSGSRTDGDVRFIFTADGKWTSIRGSQRWDITKTAYAINPKADPPTIDLVYDVASGSAATFQGICKLNGDTLTICCANPGTPRPKVFESHENSNVNLEVLKRVKK
jgi:uncharacterized protein (TIGR03067 family)